MDIGYREENITFFFFHLKKKEYRMAPSNVFSDFLERKEISVGAAGFLDLQSWVCKDVCFRDCNIKDKGGILNEMKVPE